MDQETLEALEGSIQKWQDIVNGAGSDSGCSNCKLCDVFLDREGPDWNDDLHVCCYGCPVATVSGQTDCEGTPYGAWRDSVKDQKYRPFKAVNEKQIEADQVELDFLKSLRPDSDVDPRQFIVEVCQQIITGLYCNPVIVAIPANIEPIKLPDHRFPELDLD